MSFFQKKKRSKFCKHLKLQRRHLNLWTVKHWSNDQTAQHQPAQAISGTYVPAAPSVSTPGPSAASAPTAPVSKPGPSAASAPSAPVSKPGPSAASAPSAPVSKPGPSAASAPSAPVSKPGPSAASAPSAPVSKPAHDGKTWSISRFPKSNCNWQNAMFSSCSRSRDLCFCSIFLN